VLKDDRVKSFGFFCVEKHELQDVLIEIDSL